MDRIEVFARLARANHLVMEEQAKAFVLTATRHAPKGSAPLKPEALAVEQGFLEPEQAGAVAEQLKRSTFRCQDCDWSGEGSELKLLHNHLVCGGCLKPRIGVKQLASYETCERAAANNSATRRLRKSSTSASSASGSFRLPTAEELAAAGVEAKSPAETGSGSTTRFFMPGSATEGGPRDSGLHDTTGIRSGLAASSSGSHSSLSVPSHATSIYTASESNSERREAAPTTGYHKVRRRRRFRFVVGSVLWLTLLGSIVFAVLALNDIIEVDFQAFFDDTRQDMFERDEDGADPGQWRYFGGSETNDQEN